tara:strand:- start:137 stop:304 length:168 start_codon:yes stop_codon:yes gene_type:complete
MVSDQTAANTKQQQTVDAINRNRACANVAQSGNNRSHKAAAWQQNMNNNARHTEQ